MASEEPTPQKPPQTGETRSSSAPVGSAARLMITDSFAANMAVMSDNISATQDDSGDSHEHVSGNGRQGDENTCMVSVEANEHIVRVAGDNTVQGSTQTNVKIEQHLDTPIIPRDIPSILTIAPTEGTNVSAHIEETAVKMERGGIALPSVAHAPQQPKKITLDKLRNVADSTDLAKLEAGVGVARGILDAIRLPMADSKQREQIDFLNTINGLMVKSNRTRTVVAVAGSTGAGKSSLVNAVLDEETLLTTSGFRACTAVITEISYNELDDPQQAYRAEVEFISQDDWASELKLLFNDLVEDKQLASAHIDAKTEAGIAYAKIRAVYPDLTPEMLVKSKPEQLANRDTVLNALGKTREIACTNPRDLHKTLQVYLDSKDKATKGGSRSSQDMALWPLIKVVRVYCKAEALSTGLVLVDLPGIHDANVARSAIANKYMSECSAVWVTAPIKRAVDDKSAKDLLGRGSRLQLKLDGIYSNVTFICTMTDDIQLSESIEAFDQDGQIQAILAREDELSKVVREKEDIVNKVKQRLDDTNSEYEAISNEVDIWKELKKKKNKGQQVYLPRVPAKRKRPEAPKTRSRKRPVVEDDSDPDDTDDLNPLTMEQISHKLAEIETKAESKYDECTEMEKEWDDLMQTLGDLHNEKTGIAGESNRLAIQKRNEHVKQAIQVDFAAGIMEIDEEGAEADEETFDPSIKKRDYDEVARSLPVFCISSKAFQQLCGRRKRETQVQGFKHLLDTEIPLLQNHAKKLPEKGRILAHKAFLNEFWRLLNSLTIWVTSCALELDAMKMSEQDQGYEMKHLQAAVENLKRNLSMAILAQKQELCNIRQNQFNTKSTAAIAYASKKIEKVVMNWSKKQADGGFGLPCNTYRAICRRHGSRTKSERSRDFNEDTLHPYLLKISTPWEQLFGHFIPVSLEKFAVTFLKALKDFHNTMSSRPELEKCKKVSLKLLEQQIVSHATSMKNTIEIMQASIQNEQRQASRAFLPEIKEEMTKAYSQCAVEKGPGCFLHIKEHMLNHVRKSKSTIYRKANHRVMKELDKLLESNSKEVEETAHSLVKQVEADYRTIISSSEMIEASEVARDYIRGVLYEVDSQFEKVLCMEQMDVDPSQSYQPVTKIVSANPVVPDAPQTDTSDNLDVNP
ncbi:Nuclear GTPase SLIP-GC [Cytospora mali]|uniref:Nuclear GTPase SLIP-GC n=1 Tax=Cytospora mali TaxID=578113 RepID=A0A194VN04_CYTMA|nr:Nuclear GTPase SLIP-GC [Valsa mali]